MENLNTERKLDLEELEGLAEVGGNDKEGRSASASVAISVTVAVTYSYELTRDLSWWAC